jgi:hypothetical protein
VKIFSYPVPVLIAVTVAALCSIPVMSQVSEERFEPGLWQSDTEVREIVWGEISGDTLERAQQLKATKQGTHSVSKECLTPEEAASEHGGISLGSGTCHFERFSMTGGELRALGKCSGGADGDRTMIIGGQYTSTSLESTVDIGYDLPGGGGITVKLLTNRKRIGKCPAGGLATP